ncbi:MAG: cytochrome c1 [Betaproteobacteria bacterium]|nr:MAG: cytochrome c1 [Betaproteobacteria bacterium]
MKAKFLLASLAVALIPSLSFAAGGPEVKIVGTTADRTDVASLQRGARLFVNHCLNCHSAQYMRYNRLTDLKLTPDQIKQNLMFTTDKIGDTMKAAISPKDAKEWFGAVPPDLSVMARSYTTERLGAYLRGFYKDDTREIGWNNLVSPNIGMPHVLHELSGTNTVKATVFKADGKEVKDDSAAKALAQKAFIASNTMATFEHHVEKKDNKVESSYIVKTMVPGTDGRMTPPQFDVAMADLTNFMDYVAEPHKAKRIQLGILVMFLLSILLAAAIWLKKEFWKDVH